MSGLFCGSTDGPDVGEDQRRYQEFMRSRLAVPLDEVKAWVASWGSADGLPRPQPQLIRS